MNILHPFDFVPRNDGYKDNPHISILAAAAKAYNPTIQLRQEADNNPGIGAQTKL